MLQLVFPEHGKEGQRHLQIARAQVKL